MKPARDHPRVCGEEWLPYLRITQLQGSPPRMRGRGRDGSAAPQKTGITPAYAGKSRSVQGPAGNFWDHPRVCGEEWKLFPAPLTFSGSPPRMRGRVAALMPENRVVGITPAYAGKRHLRFPLRLAIWDHPRVCGEERHFPSKCQKEVRITPAYAGKRTLYARAVRRARDHPRVCGEETKKIP